MRIGIDLMGSDQPPQLLFEAVVQVCKEFPNYSFVVFVHPKQFTSNVLSNIEFFEVSEVITMDDAPLLAVRRKKDSSIVQGIRLLKEKKIDAFVTTGNTGALVATARIMMPLMPGIEMPALCVLLPKDRGLIAVLDVGANVSFQPKHFTDYAKLGFVYQQCAQNISQPKIGLLNIGSEAQKGTQVIKESYRLLLEFADLKKMDYVGNVEGKDVFQGNIDVLVTEGFTGNIFLKTCEGVSSFLMDYLKKIASAEGGSDALRLILKDLHERFNYSKYPGAQLLGVEGLIIKCHGYSNKDALVSGIRGAFAFAKEGLVEKMKTKLQQYI